LSRNVVLSTSGIELFGLELVSVWFGVAIYSIVHSYIQNGEFVYWFTVCLGLVLCNWYIDSGEGALTSSEMCKYIQRLIKHFEDKPDRMGNNRLSNLVMVVAEKNMWMSILPLPPAQEYLPMHLTKAANNETPRTVI